MATRLSDARREINSVWLCAAPEHCIHFCIMPALWSLTTPFCVTSCIRFPRVGQQKHCELSGQQKHCALSGQQKHCALSGQQIHQRRDEDKLMRTTQVQIQYHGVPISRAATCRSSESPQVSCARSDVRCENELPRMTKRH